MRPGAVEPLRPELPVAAPAHVVHLVVREAVGRPAPVRLPAFPKCHAQPVQLKAGVLAHRNDPQRMGGDVLDEAPRLLHSLQFTVYSLQL